MGYRDDEDFGFQDLVYNTIGKPARLTPTGILGEGMPG
jgi:hypothetical protein